jgi:hypothetical protein
MVEKRRMPNPLLNTPTPLILFTLLVCACIVGVSSGAMGREEVAQRYGLNAIYLGNSSYPGAHTVTSESLDVMVFPGVNETLIRESFNFVNPFYHLTLIKPDRTKYRIVDGKIWSTDLNTVVISPAPDAKTCGECCPPSIWVAHTTQSPLAIGNLIAHEIDHMFGRNKFEDEQKPSEVITTEYTEKSKTWGGVQINMLKGSDPSNWVSWVVYI